MENLLKTYKSAQALQIALYTFDHEAVECMMKRLKRFLRRRGYNVTRAEIRRAMRRVYK